MSATGSPDKRLQQLQMSKGELNRVDLEASLTDLPDLSENVRRPGEEELEELRQDLLAEHGARQARIERFLHETQEPAPPPASILPIDPEI